MKQFKINNQDVNVPESWEDVKLRNYIEYQKLHNTQAESPIDETEFAYKIYDKILGINNTINTIKIKDLALVTECLSFTTIPPSPKAFLIKNVFNINGVDYVAKPYDLDELTSGEVISIDVYKNMKKDYLDLYPYVMAILCRPAIQKENTETGKTEWELEVFDTKNVEYRANLFLDNFNCQDVINITDFFFAGSNQLAESSSN